MTYHDASVGVLARLYFGVDTEKMNSVQKAEIATDVKFIENRIVNMIANGISRAFGGS